VTVLFADLVGFTAHSERLDPEDVQAVLAPYHARLRFELERFGGTVEKFIGDAVMALFGAPVAHEDDPERAVRAGLAIRDWIAEEGRLQVRIGIQTGEALINLDARPETGEGMAAGDVVNTAARLQSAAPTNGIVVGETTYRATAHTIDFRESPPVVAKGKEAPIRVWEVVQARARFGVDLAPRSAGPLVGRERELDALKATLTRARLQRSPELVTLVGVPGIGKSRLVSELFASIERGEQDSALIYWRQGRSLPYGEGVSYWALAEMIKAHAGILETDDADAADAKLRRALDGLLDEDADWVGAHVSALVGQAATSDVASAPREEAFAAWRRFFEALADERPLVLVFEDIQWADDGLLDFIEHLADWVRGVPMLILCTARLELLERRPAWGGGKLNAATIALAALSEEDTAKLIAALASRPLLEAETQAALLERAGGNPLYAEQYVRMLAERRALEELPLPESVQGIIAARLDSLPAAEKTLLQDAAVIGKVFWVGALTSTERDRSETERLLHALERKEFVQRARRASVAGETEFAFKHLLVRDVAYGQIPRAERAEKHRRAAEWIESLGRPEDHAEMVAHHYASALELAHAAGKDTTAFAATARAALREAGDRAATLYAFAQADQYYAQALELAKVDERELLELLFRQGRVRYAGDYGGAEQLESARDGFLAAGDRERAAEAELMLADIGWHSGHRERAMAHLERARALTDDADPSRVRAAVLAEIARYEMLAEHHETAIATGGEALRMADALGLDELRAELLNTIGSARMGINDEAGGLRDLEESVELSARLDSVASLVRAYNNLGTMNVILGRLDAAGEQVRESYRLAKRFGHHGFARFSEGGPLLGAAYHEGRWDDVVAGADAFLADVSPSYQRASASGLRGLIRLGRDEAAGAVEDAERAVEAATLAADPQILLPTWSIAAAIWLSSTNEPRARDLLDEALPRLVELQRLGFAGVWSHSLAWVAWSLGRGDEFLDAAGGDVSGTPWVRAARHVAAGEFAAAAVILGAIGAKSEEAFYRLRSGEGLGPALDFYRSVRATRYIREGEALLAATA
jgi:class 3 adenylate cyclase